MSDMMEEIKSRRHDGSLAKSTQPYLLMKAWITLKYAMHSKLKNALTLFLLCLIKEKTVDYRQRNKTTPLIALRRFQYVSPDSFFTCYLRSRRQNKYR